MFELLLAAAIASGMTSDSVVEAERAYAAMAQHDGQWTAFRTTAGPGAVMFTPEPVDAAQWLAGRKDPKTAISWQPAAAFVSCDGRTAATTGPWQYGSGNGYFATVWARGGRTWYWTVDFGGSLDQALPAAPQKVPVRRASCRKPDPSRLPSRPDPAKFGKGSSSDRSLEWRWEAGENGSAHIIVYLWNGREYEPVIDKVS